MTEMTRQITIPGVPEETCKKLEILAEQDHRKLAAYVRIILEKHVQAAETFGLTETPKSKSVAA